MQVSTQCSIEIIELKTEVIIVFGIPNATLFEPPAL